jgi:hypothetical protein
MRSARGDVRDHVAQGEVFLLTHGHSPASDDRGQGVVHCFCKPLMLQRQRSFQGGARTAWHRGAPAGHYHPRRSAPPGALQDRCRLALSTRGFVLKRDHK